MDKNNIIGYILLFGLLIGYVFWSGNKAKELEAQEIAKQEEQARVDSLNQIRIQDSLAQVKTTAPLVADTTKTVTPTVEQGPPAAAPTPVAPKEAEYVSLESENLKLTLSNKGGRIVSAELLGYESFDTHFDESNTEKKPVKIYDESTSKFNWVVNGIESESLYYNVEKGSNSVSFTNTETGISQKYELDQDNPYLINYSVQLPDDEASLEWATHFRLQEQDMRSDREFTFMAYKTDKGKFKKFKKLKDNADLLISEPIDYLTQRQRFFNQTFIGDGLVETKLKSSFDKEDLTEFTKLLESETEVELSNGQGDYQIFISPNERTLLAQVDKKLVNIQPVGIFGLTKALAWLFNVFRPLFSNYGLLILLMTLLIKLILTPLTYKSYLSQAKMAVLKPELAELKEQYPDDQAKYSQEQMKLYGKAGVNPLGGCLPSVLQIPIFFSLYYFFRSSIFFRQKEFLWAKDLSTYDSIIDLPFNLPLVGSHISLFAILYGVALFFSMRVNRGMMTGGMPTAPSTKKKGDGPDMQNMMQMQMKIMQYGMPIFLPLVFNAFPAALTFYYFCYNVINALQTLIIKKFVINEDKILEKIEENKAKPKKKGGMRQRFEQAMKAQQELQAEKQKNAKKKK